MSRQTTSTIMMIRPVKFRYNEQTAVNNYYQKVLDELDPEEVQAKMKLQPKIGHALNMELDKLTVIVQKQQRRLLGIPY